jgi:hypothetical protein
MIARGLTGLVIVIAGSACTADPTPRANGGAFPSPAQPPSATHTPGGGGPVSDSMRAQDFELNLTADNAEYAANEPITVEATLTYTGPAAQAILYGSGTGPIGFSVERLEDGFNPAGSGPAFTTDCSQHPYLQSEPVRYPFQKSGGFSADDPNADAYEAYLNDPLLRLPPGTWRISAGASGYLGPGDCVGPLLNLQAEVTVTVTP